ncbi:hypothetical protein IQ241_00905 [Romeria aff. gracilis LEGE 07310]|uniref:Uncharacterized protein n=1 Tax=Vasconcelosia minhoensis LEGE 07310 TaxID=915328 RepID=A0A8J7AI72_9CYAN|nr:hypothetical protein [Romeria gracilis]MBE9075870.1 hypothetical protein [Romeria aff. gracilis LEGE 07310]
MSRPSQSYRQVLATYLKPQGGRVLWLAVMLLLNPQIFRYFIRCPVGDFSESVNFSFEMDYAVIAKTAIAWMAILAL